MPFLRHGSRKNQPNPLARIISLCIIVWCLVTPSTKVCSGYTATCFLRNRSTAFTDWVTGPCLDSASWNRQCRNSRICFVALYCRVCSGVASSSVLSLCYNRHRIQVLPRGPYDDPENSCTTIQRMVVLCIILIIITIVFITIISIMLLF